VDEAPQAETTNTPRLIGGEMLLWSDLSGEHGPGPVSGAAVTPLLAAARGRVLVAGPHDPALLDALPSGTDVTVLVRGVPDAEQLARRPELTVLCGGPAKLTAEPAFDTIVALAGLERLGTAESDELTWAETLGLLRSALTSDGVLILGAENPMGMRRLVAPPRVLTDADWTPGYDETRPTSPETLRAALGLASRAYAVYPELLRPETVLPAGATGGASEAAVERALASTAAEAVVDPVPLALDAVRNGLGLALAPAWIVVAARDESLLPDVVAAPPGTGETMERLVLRAAARRDLPRVRELLTAWQGGDAAGVPAGQVLRDEDGTLTALATATSPAEALFGLAVRLLRGGFPHPWVNVRDEADLAATLTTMTGADPEPAASLQDSAQPQDVPGSQGGAGSQGGPGSHGGAGSQEGVPHAATGVLPFAELVADRERLTRELAEVRSQAASLEAELTAREEDLRRVRHTVELLSGTGPAKAGQAFVGGVRAARRVLRRFG
jgi:hypothetical protein